MCFTRISFNSHHLHRVTSFDCGTKPYQKEVGEWIKGSFSDSDSALKDIAAGRCEVWIYEDAISQDIIGFTSLGEAKWNLPKATDKTRVQIIPNFAIDNKFKRKPEGKPEEEWFSSLIFEDVLLMAQSRYQTDPELKYIGLLVFQQNTRAIELYARYGFVSLGTNKHGYNRMMVAL